jgi:diketogulonate reductase-like aldo/keto reductase
MVGIGSWLYNASVAKETIKMALEVGYRAIDTAYDYQNSEGIGEALQEAFQSKELERKDLFITTKVEGGLNSSRTFEEHETNLKNLQVDYVDLLLIHFPDYISPQGDLTGSKKMRQDQWRAMEKLHKEGKARAIGISHYCRRQLDDVLEIATVKPAINQVEFHVGVRKSLLIHSLTHSLTHFFTQQQHTQMGSAGVNATDDRAYLESKGVTFQSFSPLCGPCCMGDTTGKCTFNEDLITGEMVTSIGAKYNKTGAQVSLKWQVQQGIPVIPKTNNKEHLEQNIDLFGWELSKEDMHTLTSATSPPVSGGGDGLTSGDCAMP